MKFQFNTIQGPDVALVFSNDESNDLFQFAKNHSSFAGKKAEVYYLPSKEGEGEYLLGLGEEEKLDLEVIRLAIFNLVKACKTNKSNAVHVNLPKVPSVSDELVLIAALEAALQTEYKFTRKQKIDESEETSSEDLVLSLSTTFDAPETLETEVRNLMDGLFFARNLVNRTANEIYPETLANETVEAFKDLDVEVSVFDEQKIQELGMHAFYAVAKGSDNPPRFITVEYKGNPESEEKTVLVGKGLTYDSGGYSIKSAKGMVTMHCDMGGAGTVLGTVMALAKNKAKTNVTAVIAAAENLISGRAMKTGDIISSLSGKSIEVLNTDAEGRLTLADAIYYATDTLQADRVIDLATLTGAVLAALSSEFTGAITNNVEFYREFETAATEMGEKVWLLPNDDDLREHNRSSKVADLVNSTDKGAGTITAGQFVGEFLAKDVPWIHLDIAGTAYASSAKKYLPERASGVHVKALYHMLKQK